MKGKVARRRDETRDNRWRNSRRNTPVRHFGEYTLDRNGKTTPNDNLRPNQPMNSGNRWMINEDF